MAIVPGRRLGPYEILSAIGAGGMGEVYRARDTRLDRIVAIKVLPNVFVLNANRLARFQHRAKVLVSLNQLTFRQSIGLETFQGRSFLIHAAGNWLGEDQDQRERIFDETLAVFHSCSVLRLVFYFLFVGNFSSSLHRRRALFLVPRYIRNAVRRAMTKQVPARPTRETLQKMPAKRILRALDFGVMMGVAGPMKREEREAVASFLGTGAAEAGPPASAFCAAGSRVMSGPAKGSWNGWSPDTSNTRYQTAEQAGLTTDQVRHLKLKWAYGFSGDITSFAAPTVLEGTLFMGSAGGTVQAVNAKTGCLYWVFDANGPVRSAIRAVRNGASYSLIFTDLNGGVYSLEAKTGRLLWKRRVEDHEATRLTGLRSRSTASCTFRPRLGRKLARRIRNTNAVRFVEV